MLKREPSKGSKDQGSSPGTGDATTKMDKKSPSIGASNISMEQIFFTAMKNPKTFNQGNAASKAQGNTEISIIRRLQTQEI